MAKKFYLTTAISYPNGKPHIGHAYEAIAADAVARFQAMRGRDVCLITGTDEHGLKMVQAARDAGYAPLDYSDKMSCYFRDMCDRFAVSYTRFVRTSTAEHHRAAQSLWQAMVAAGDLYLDRYEGWYSVRDEAFYDDSELQEVDGVRLSPQGTEVEWTSEESWFFRLSAYQGRLLDLYKEHPEFIRPQSRYNEILRFVEGGLKDLSISRTSFDWGVSVPTAPPTVPSDSDSSRSESPRHVMYVWVDALTAYMTGVGYPDDKQQFEHYWPADLHLVGKDIIRFHAVYWPAFLMSAGLPLPKQIFAHGFLLNRGEKMSKSRGNVVEPTALAEQVGLDALRYYLLREVSFGRDGSYSHAAIVQTANSDLANSFGNLAQRCLSMIVKNIDGRLVAFDRTVEDTKLLAMVAEATQMDIPKAFESLQFSVGCVAWLQVVSACNQYIDEQAPWVLRKTDPQRMQAVLMVLFLAIRDLAIAISPVIPTKCAELLEQMGVVERDFASLEAGTGWFDKLVESDFRLAKPIPLFPRLDLPAEENR